MEFSTEWLRNPAIFAVNRYPAHSSHSFVSPQGQSFTQCLDGVWDFLYSENLQEMPADAHLPSCVLSWENITVPGMIQLQGDGKYGTPHYVNTMYPWDGHEKIVPGEIPTRYNPVGIYRKSFSLPEQWDKSSVFVRFDGVDAALALWCNGQFVGYAEDTFTPSEFSLSHFLQDGENILCAKVFRFCSGSWLEDQDFWRFSGIFRSVTLYTVPKVHAWDVFLTADCSARDGYASGLLAVRLKLRGGAGSAVLECEGGCASVNFSEDVAGKTEIQLTLTVPNPCLWSAEAPHLYDVQIIISDASGNVTEKIPLKAGFRHFALEGGLMKLNGKRIVFKGVNRHEWNCRTGRTLTREDMLWDVKNMKRHNINAVRTSHYPNDVYFYDLCDEYGLYIIDEANLETHGTWQHPDIYGDENTVPGNHPQWADIVLDRAKSMLERDKNHASILLWSCGNESFGGENIFKMSEYFRHTDPTRLVHYEGVFNDRSFNATSDIESQMYTSVHNIRAFLAAHREKPFICCEYSHAMGNSCGALHKYTQLTVEEPLYQGGFIWDYIDQGLVKMGPDGKEFLAYGGDYGDTPTDYNFCMNGIVYANRENSPKVQEVKACYADVEIAVTQTAVRITNNFLFTPLSAFTLHLASYCNGFLIAEQEAALKALPGDTEIVAIPLALAEQNAQQDGVVHIRAEVRRNTNMASACATVGDAIAVGECVWSVEQKNPQPCELPIEVTDGDFNIGVRGANFAVMFSKKTGGMMSYRAHGHSLLNAILPQLSFWRASTDNDRGNDFPFEQAQWIAAGQFAKTSGVALKSTPTQAIIECVLTLATPARHQVGVRYTVTGDGAVETRLTWLSEDEACLPEFGMQICTAPQLAHVAYYGNGPEENYVDRCTGAYFGRYTFDVADNFSRYVNPQECGNRTCVYEAVLHGTTKNSTALRFTGDGMHFSALPYTPQELENARHCYDLPPIVKTVVRCSIGQTGVAGDDSWGSKTHPEYRLSLHKGDTFAFTMQGIRL